VYSLRKKEPVLPMDFDAIEKAVQKDITLSLLNHSPKERPTSLELLQSGKLPVQVRVSDPWPLRTLTAHMLLMRSKLNS